jgi:hypothetical protein
MKGELGLSRDRIRYGWSRRFFGLCASPAFRRLAVRPFLGLPAGGAGRGHMGGEAPLLMGLSAASSPCWCFRVCSAWARARRFPEQGKLIARHVGRRARRRQRVLPRRHRARPGVGRWPAGLSPRIAVAADVPRIRPSASGSGWCGGGGLSLLCRQCPSARRCAGDSGTSADPESWSLWPIALGHARAGFHFYFIFLPAATWSKARRRHASR